MQTDGTIGQDIKERNDFWRKKCAVSIGHGYIFVMRSCIETG
jgi:hypothetical protein